jgi:hypothetical protein
MAIKKESLVFDPLLEMIDPDAINWHYDQQRQQLNCLGLRND